MDPAAHVEDSPAGVKEDRCSALLKTVTHMNLPNLRYFVLPQQHPLHETISALRHVRWLWPCFSELGEMT